MYQKIVLATIVLAGLFVSLLTEAHHDIRFFIVEMQRVSANSEQLYVDTIDINSPSSYLSTYIPITLAQFIPLSAEQLFKLFVFISIIVVIYLLRKTITVFFRDHHHLALALLLTAFIFVPGSNFGQRDHLFILLGLPYLLHRYLVVSEKAQANIHMEWVYALLIMIGLSFKPIYFIVVCISELYFALTFHQYKTNLSVRMGFWKLIFFSIVYVGLLQIGFPKYLFWFFNAGPLYSDFTANNSFIKEIDIILIAVAFGIVLVKSILVRLTSEDRFLILLSVACITTTMLQGKGFSHHYIPLETILFVFIIQNAAIILSTQKKVFATLLIPPVVATILITIYIPLATSFYPQLTTKSTVFTDFIQQLDQYTTNGKIAVYNTELYPTATIDRELDAKWITKYRNFWFLPGLYTDNIVDRTYAYNSPSTMSEIEQIFFYTTIHDIQNNQPGLIISNQNRIKNGFGANYFNFIDYFNQNPAYQQWFSQKYVPVLCVHTFYVYQFTEDSGFTTNNSHYPTLSKK